MPPSLRKIDLVRRLPKRRAIFVPGYFVDNFNNGVNDANLSGRTPTKTPIGNTWAVNSGAAATYNGKLELRFPVQNSAIVSYDMGTPDAMIRAKVTFPASGTVRTADVIARRLDNSNYLVFRVALASNYIRLGKVIANTFSWGTNTQTITIQPGVEYTLEISCSGNNISGRIYGLAGANSFSMVETDLNTATRFGLRAQNDIGALPIVYDDVTIDPPIASDATASIAESSAATSDTRIALTLVDNNLMYSGATTQKTTARDNLNGTLHDLAFFVDSFGHNETMAGWNGTGTLPTPNLTAVYDDLNANYAALGSPRLQAFMHRIPWQITGVRSGGGSTVPSTQADYSSEGRRLLTDKASYYVAWVRSIAARLMTDWGVRIFHCGSEMKGFQGRARDSIAQKWDFENYAGTAGHADMGFYYFYTLFRQGLQQAASDAGINFNTVIAVAPYPVVSHQGVSNANSVTFDSRNDSASQAVDYTRLNGDNVTYGGFGYPNKAATEAFDEFLKLAQANAVPIEWVSSDMGTYNNDNVPTPTIDSFDLAYRRFKGHLQWYKQRMAARGFSGSKLALSEWYAKEQWDMSVAGGHFVADALRATRQASIKACAYIAMLEEGVHSPNIWSPFGRGDQSTDAADDADPMQWYGGMVVRTVTNNSSHAGSAVTGGGAALPFLDVVSAIHDYFAPGTQLYAMTFSDSANWKGIATATKALVVNKAATTKTISINGQAAETFSPYQTRLISR